MKSRITTKRIYLCRATKLLALMLLIMVTSTRLQADIETSGACGGASIAIPFTDLQSSNIFFCAIAEAYIAGLTNGTSPTTYDPSQDVPREQMAAFITRTLDQGLRRGSSRAAAQQWWTLQNENVLSATDLGSADNPSGIAWDGADLWVANFTSDTVSRVRASDGKLLQTWTDADGASAVIAAAGRIFITGELGASIPGKVYVIDPAAAPGPVTVFENFTGPNPRDITFDGVNLWTANQNNGVSFGSITRINAMSGVATTFAAGFGAPSAVLWDGANLWVADLSADLLRRVDPFTGVNLGSTPVGDAPTNLLFDGANLWVSNLLDDSITVVRGAGNLRGTILATITGNGLNGPRAMAFDGERVLVVNVAVDSVSLFKAADFTPLGSLLMSSNSDPSGVCSDGLNFWITRQGPEDLVRY